MFVHREQLHVSYSGCVHQKGELKVSICLARLPDDLEVEDAWCPELPSRNDWEKNHAFFSHDGDLYAVHTVHSRLYMVHGHRANELQRDNIRDVPQALFGVLRGGAPPVLHNGEYYHWFHGVNKGIYNVGLYTFAPSYPFQPLRMTRLPLLYLHPGERPGPHVANVVFPAGAIHRGGNWHISYGYFDRETRVISFSAGSVEDMLEPI